jgi:5,10-methenyltetrahydrofolate synthetase
MTSAAQDWTAVRAWRRQQRARLSALRRAAAAELRERVQANVDLVLQTLLDALPQDASDRRICIACYWPIAGEIDLFAPMARALARGAQAALPVVVAADQPLEFRPWTPGMRMAQGAWNIPVPDVAAVVEPSVVLVPLVGFDAGRHRLGNGGGYYDRTLAQLAGRALRIGVGLESLRLETIWPQPHDVPMQLIVTEAPPDLARLRALLSSDRDGASPPCALGDLDPEQRGF